MAFIEMLSDASLLNLLIEMLMIEVLRGSVPQSRLQESAEKSNTSSMHQNEARFQARSPFQLFSRISMELFCSQHPQYFKYLPPSFIMQLYLPVTAAASQLFNI